MIALPILMFHSLDTRLDARAYAPVSFARVIKLWHDAGWRSIALDDAVRHIRAGEPFPPRRVALTFDDGFASVYRVAFPILASYQWTATIFFSPGEKTTARNDEFLPPYFDRAMLRWGEIREMRAHGFAFGSHTLTHCDLTRADAARAAREISESQKIVADALGAPCTLFAYPKGRYNPRVRALAAAHYDAAFSTKLGLVNAQSDWFGLERVEMFYLRAEWAAKGLMQNWFPYYLAARNVPRRLRQLFVK